MGDHGEAYATYTESMCSKMKELAEMADILTPNLTEACILTKRPYKKNAWSRKEIEDLAEELLDMGPSGVVITGVRKGSLSENVFQDRGTIAGSVHVDAVDNGGEGNGIQAYTAIKEIMLAVEESKIALTPDGIQLQVGESTVIRLSKDGITIVGGSVFIN